MVTQPVLFLDIDGVLNSHRLFKKIKEDGIPTPEEQSLADELHPLYGGFCHIDVIRTGIRHIDPSAVKLLNEILEASKAKVVVSSTWRLGNPLECIDKMLKFHGFTGELIGMTEAWLDRDKYPQRGNEIQEWLDRHPDVGSFVIIDDDSDMAHLMNHLVKTQFAEGLLPEHIEPALQILSELVLA
jgi:hypothetical protein